MKEKKYIVYKHISPSGKIYIGQTCQSLKKRFRHDGTGYRGSTHFAAAIQKYGWNNFEHSVIADELTKKEADWLEIYLISYYNSNNPHKGYNLSNGGRTCAGVKRSEEFKRHLSEINKGKVLTAEHKRKISESNKGKKLSAEHRMLLSEINKGKKLSPEHIKKLRQINKIRVRTKEEIEKSVSKRRGIPLSEEIKKKLSESHKGKPSWNKGKHLSKEHKDKLSKSSLNRKDVSKPVVCVETGIVYPSAYEAGRVLNTNPSHISACRNGKRKTAGGFHWKYTEQPTE